MVMSETNHNLGDLREHQKKHGGHSFIIILGQSSADFSVEDRKITQA